MIGNDEVVLSGLLWSWQLSGLLWSWQFYACPSMSTIHSPEVMRRALNFLRPPSARRFITSSLELSTARYGYIVRLGWVCRQGENQKTRERGLFSGFYDMLI
jgi:hypothetical protein